MGPLGHHGPFGRTKDGQNGGGKGHDDSSDT
jgi:hypothetical protein